MKDPQGHGSNGGRGGVLSNTPRLDAFIRRAGNALVGARPDAIAASELHSGTPKSAPAPVHDAWASTPGGDRGEAGPVTDHSATGKSGPAVHDGGMAIRRAASLERLE